MVKTCYINSSIRKYLECLASHTPAPGGGSAAALTAALATALLSMVAHFSIARIRRQPDYNVHKDKEIEIKRILAVAARMRKRLTQLVDLDACAYFGVVKAREKSLMHKQRALEKACTVPYEVCKLSLEAIRMCPALIKKGNPNLLGDVQTAVNLLQAAYNSALINLKENSCACDAIRRKRLGR